MKREVHSIKVAMDVSALAAEAEETSADLHALVMRDIMRAGDGIPSDVAGEFANRVLAEIPQDVFDHLIAPPAREQVAQAREDVVRSDLDADEQVIRDLTRDIVAKGREAGLADCEILAKVFSMRVAQNLTDGRPDLALLPTVVDAMNRTEQFRDTDAAGRLLKMDTLMADTIASLFPDWNEDVAAENGKWAAQAARDAGYGDADLDDMFS